MKSLLAAIAIPVVASGALFVAPAHAGEFTGSGKTTPIKDRGVAASECAFSGLEDYADSPLRTQTPHKVYVEYIGIVVMPEPGTAGRACNPAKGG
jgi:hypothetical protein